jgi:hypothetical protein
MRRTKYVFHIFLVQLGHRGFLLLYAGIDQNFIHQRVVTCKLLHRTKHKFVKYKKRGQTNTSELTFHIRHFLQNRENVYYLSLNTYFTLFPANFLVI